jgi:hypothetical protein
LLNEGKGSGQHSAVSTQLKLRAKSKSIFHHRGTKSAEERVNEEKAKRKNGSNWDDVQPKPKTSPYQKILITERLTMRYA